MAFNKSDVVNIDIIIANTKSGRSSKGFSASSDSFVFMTACWVGIENSQLQRKEQIVIKPLPSISSHNF